MKTTSLLLFLAFLHLFSAHRSVAQSPAGAEAPPPARYVEGELLVKFAGGPRGPAAERARHAEKHEVKRHFDFIGWQHIRLPAGMSVEEGLRHYRRLPEVLAVEPNFTTDAPADEPQFHPASAEGIGGATAMMPNDPLLDTQWCLDRIGMPLAWEMFTGSTNVVVAILNTGINYYHEELRDNMWRNPGEIPGNGIDDDGNGYVDDVYGIDTADDPRGNDSDPWDESDRAETPGLAIYRGSAVASIVGAAANNAAGIAGINWNIRLMALRAVTTNGTMSIADQIDALNYLVLMKSRGVNVKAVQISNSGTTFSAAAKAVYDAVGNAGILVAAGVALSSSDLDVSPRYPPCFDSPGMTAVTVSSVADRLVEGANFGRTNVDLAAPGVNIVQASGPGTNNYIILYGTSQAAAHVAGAAAFLAGAYPDATVQQIKEALLESVDVLPSFTNRTVSGGRLNLARALFHRHFVSTAAPRIVAQPHGQTVPPGSTVTLRVSAAGTEPLFYTWRREGVDLIQSGNPSLTLTNLLSGDAGEYTVIVSNAFGAVTSLVARLIVQPEPVTFTRIMSGPHVTTSGNHVGVAWGDFDNDEDPDLFVAREGGGNLLYRNNGDGTFASVSAGVGDAANSWGCAWGDYDRDGFLDLFVANGGNQREQDDFLYRNNGNGTFTRMTTNTVGGIVAEGGASIDCGWADSDRDGFLDLFVANGSFHPQPQANAFYRNLGTGRFSRINEGDPATDRGHAVGVAWGDFDGDGFPDLFVANRLFEKNALYRNEGAGGFQKVVSGDLVNAAGYFIGGAWGDCDNDGDLDLLIAREGQCLVYRNDGAGVFTRLTIGNIATDFITASGCAWADYDNDGLLDFVTASEHEFSALYHNEGGGTFRRVTTGSIVGEAGNWFGCAWADYNRDGFLDLIVASYGQPNALYRNQGNSNHWLQVKCRGTASNRNGVGAKVRVHARIAGREVWQLREIGAGDGVGGQDELNAAFGLGDATMADTLRIQWPSGAVQELTDVAANQFLTLTEPGLGITQQPQDLVVRLGANTNFAVAAFSDQPAGAWTYQWLSNGVALAGQTASNLPMANARISLEAGYSVIVSDGLRAATSRVARLVVLVTPTIAQPPLSQSVVEGGSVTFSVGSTGWPPPFTYEWRKGSIGVVTNMHSLTVDFMTLTNVPSSAAGNYRVVIKNAASPTGVPSGFAVLTVLADADRDGLPDQWEGEHGLTAPELDADGDGVSNRDEYLAGTNPTNALDYLRVDRISSGPGGVRLEFMAASNLTYTVERTENLEPGGWLKLADIIARPTNRAEVLFDPEPGPRRSYRLVTPRQP